MIIDIVRGVLAYVDAVKYLFRARVGWLAWAPGIVAALIGGIYLWLIFSYRNEMSEWLFAWYSWDKGEEIAKSVGGWLTIALLILFYIVVFKYIVLIVGAPFMSPLSELIEEQEKEVTGRLKRRGEFLKDIIRGLRINIRNLCRELLLTMILFLVGLIPGMAILTGPLMFVVAAYYAGFGNMDFTLERHLDYSSSIRFVKRNKGLALGNGLVFVFLLTIPIIGVLVALPLATTAATRETLKKL